MQVLEWKGCPTYPHLLTHIDPHVDQHGRIFKCVALWVANQQLYIVNCVVLFVVSSITESNFANKNKTKTIKIKIKL